MHNFSLTVGDTQACQSDSPGCEGDGGYPYLPACGEGDREQIHTRVARTIKPI